MSNATSEEETVGNSIHLETSSKRGHRQLKRLHVGFEALGSNFDYAVYQLRDLGQVTKPKVEPLLLDTKHDAQC